MDTPDKIDPPAGEPGPPAPDQPERRRGLLSGELWELEMVIAGAVVFALVQLSQALNAGFDHLAPQLSTGGLAALVVVTYYSKGILYALIACFLLNVAARAYWAGLLGLNAVFPEGIRWERLRYGPIATRVYRERLPGLASQIARVDRFCSAIFSFTFVIVVLFLLSIAVSGLAGGLAWALDRALFGGGHFKQLFYGILFAVLLPMLAGSVLDKAFGKRLAPDSRAARWIARLNVFAYHVSLNALHGPVLLALFSNVRKRVIYPVFYAVFLGLVGLVLVDLLVREGDLDYDAYAYLPAEPGSHSVEPSRYANLRPAGEVTEDPWVQSDVIRDPYVKLFIPYSPRRGNEVLAERCPGVRPLQAEGLRRHREEPAPAAREEAVLGCLARLYRVTLDGRPVPGLALRFSSDPPTGLRGVVAYIPTAGLPRGENVLSVTPLPPPRGSRRPARPPYWIPFWL